MTRSVSTLKNIMTIATFALLPLAVVNVSAQAKAHVDVPWGFVANHHYVPAGNYEVLTSENTMTLIDADSGRTAAVLLIRKEGGSEIENRGRLEFYVSGSRHTLVEAQFAGSSMHSILLGQPKPERTVARNSDQAKTFDIAMN
jgi:hypothetical protein